MRCLQCGEKLVSAAELERKFCSTAHRMLYQWRRTQNSAPSIIELVNRAEDGESELAPSRPLHFSALDAPHGFRRPRAEADDFPRPAAIPAARLALDLPEMRAGRPRWTLHPGPGVRQPRLMRGPLIFSFPGRKRLPERPAPAIAHMPHGAAADLFRSVSRNRRYLQPRTDKPLPLTTVRARAVMSSLRNQLTVTDIEPPKPVVADLRRKVMVAASTASPTEPDQFQQVYLPGPVAPPAPVATAPLGALLPPVQISGLESLANHCLDIHLRSARVSGAESWIPGPEPYPQPERPASSPTGLHLVPAEPTEPLTPEPSLEPLHWTTLLRPDESYSARLPEARPAPAEWVAPPIAVDHPDRPIAAFAPEPMDPVPITVPQSAIAALRLRLHHPGLTAAQPSPPVALSVEPRREPGYATLQPVAPAAQFPSLPIRSLVTTGCTLPSHDCLWAVRPSPARHHSAAFSSAFSWLPYGADPSRPAVPRMAAPRPFAPPLARTLLRVAPQAAVQFSGGSFRRADLAPMSADPVRFAPKLEIFLTQDEEVAEAVRRFRTSSSTSLLQTLRSSLPSLKPSPRTPRGPAAAAPSRMKWALISAPVLLAAGYLTVHQISARPEAAPAAPASAPVSPAEPISPETPIPAAAPSADAPASPDPAPTRTPVANAAPAPEKGFFATVRAAIRNRAAISLSDDFRSGLGDWSGDGEWSRKWSYDAAGFLNTGPSVVLYTPSLKLVDYRMDFLGQIDRRSMGWVVRATDHRNYHAGKITLTTPGPLPRAIVEHYAVVNGRADKRQSRVLPLEIRADTLYRVRVEVEGQDFTLSVQGQIVDHWSDNRHPSGGVGFFSERGEQSRLRWVEITHQADTLGRLCAFLAPYSAPARERNQE